METKSKIDPGELFRWGLYIGGGILLYKLGNQILYTGTASNTALSEDICNSVNPDLLTYPEIEYASSADQLESAFWAGFGFYELDEEIAMILLRMNSIEDIIELICAYGIRGRGVAIKEYYSLPKSVTKFLDKELKQAVNLDYETRGINFQW